MAGSLNRAFMRAYAKDRAQAKLDAAAKTSSEASATSQPTPPAPQIFSSRYSPAPSAEAPTVRRNTAATYRSDSAEERSNKPIHHSPASSPGQHSVPHGDQQVAHARYDVNAVPRNMPTEPPTYAAPEPEYALPVSAPTRPMQPSQKDSTHMDPTHMDPRHVAPRHVAPPMESSNYDVGPEGVWQRIDNAHRDQAPNTVQLGTRPVANSMAVTGQPYAAHASAANSAPPARSARPTLQPSEIDIPLLSQPNEELHHSHLADSQSNESRRRSVADFLYTAGQVAAMRQLPTRPSAGSSEFGTATAAQPRTVSPLPLHAQNMPASTQTVQPPNVQSNYYPDSQPENQSRYAADNYAADYETDNETDYQVEKQTEHYGPMEPTVDPRKSDIGPMPRRMGQILRVDVPRSPKPDEARADEARARQSVAAPPARSMPARSMPAEPSGRAAPKESIVERTERKAQVEQDQRRMDVAYEASEVEQKLRSSQHKIFNPVWEVDSLQWPSVCDKLMEQRAQSMAQVAAHLKMACQDGLNVLGVTSSSKSEGRTTVACCLARLASMHGLSVALVDLDLDNPTLCLQTNMEVEQDWRDTLESETTLEDIAVHSIDDQLTIVPLKPRGGRPGILSSDQRLAEMLTKISESFDLVIVDTCRLSSTGNVIAGLSKSKIFDAAIVVVDRRNSNQDRVDQSVRTLQDAGIESIGIVDNFSM